MMGPRNGLRSLVRVLVVAALSAAASSFRVSSSSAVLPPHPAWASRLFARELSLYVEPGTQPDQAKPTPPEKADRKCRCFDPATRAKLARCFPFLLLHDTGSVFGAPARWGKKPWGLVAAGVVGVGALTLVDDDLRTAVLRSHGGIQDTAAKIFEPFGSWAAFATLGGFYVGGLATHDDKARGVALDGLVASLIAGGLITPVLKEIAGRSRPKAGEGPHRFEPFRGGPSFPSGHATEAFAVASVIATEYPARWVQAACYVPASLVLFARMRHDAHWASDVTAGALIGYGVGHTVARLNLSRRLGEAHVQILPLLAPKEPGVLLTARF
jgi:membrane-associated phospholipid phosphatase